MITKQPKKESERGGEEREREEEICK